MIHICYSFRDESGKYPKFVGTSMLSMFENTHEKITVHLLHDSTLNKENKKKLNQIVYKYDQEIIFYNLSELALNRIKEIQNRIPVEKINQFTIAMFYRLLAPNLIDAEKIIYFDADTIVNLDINELWQIDLKSYPIAAIPEAILRLYNESWIKNIFPLCRENIIDWREYFNSGVLIMNLDSIRKLGDLLEMSLNMLEKLRDYSYPDQDALNMLFKKNYLSLPEKFNLIADLIRKRNSQQPTKKFIFHYANQALMIDISDVFNRVWFDYFIKTPFCIPNSFFNLFNYMFELIQKNVSAWKKLHLAGLSKERIFFLTPEDENIFLNFFGKKETDLLIDATQLHAFDFLIQTMQKFHGQKIFILCVPNVFYEPLKEKIAPLGLVEDIDFFNGTAIFEQADKKFVLNDKKMVLNI